MPKLPDLAGMDLAALLCSRVCHDVISPVGAIANGIELLDEGADEDTAEIAMDLIRSSAKNASARLQFARIAFGAAGSAGAHIDTGDAEAVARSPTSCTSQCATAQPPCGPAVTGSTIVGGPYGRTAVRAMPSQD